MRLNLNDGRRRPPEIHPLGADGTSRSRSQQGGTLLEALVAIVIVSVLLVGVIAGMAVFAVTLFTVAWVTNRRVKR